MSKLFLENLCNYNINLYNKTDKYSSSNECKINEQILVLKSNNFYNENIHKHNYEYINLFCSNINEKYKRFDELMMLNPLAIKTQHDEEYSLLNAIYITIIPDYIYKTTNQKLQYINDNIEKYNNEIEYFNIKLATSSFIINELCKYLKISLIIIENNNIKIYNKEQEQNIIIYKYETESIIEYLPIINNTTKYYNKTHHFTRFVYTEGEIQEPIRQEEKYDEVFSSEDYTFVSESASNTIPIIINSTKKNKKSKDIFIQVNKPKLEALIENSGIETSSNSVFKNTELTKLDITNIIDTYKTVKIDELRNYAIKLNINILEGSTKTGKPKFKSRTVLLELIKTKLNI